MVVQASSSLSRRISGARDQPGLFSRNRGTYVGRKRAQSAIAGGGATNQELHRPATVFLGVELEEATPRGVRISAGVMARGARFERPQTLRGRKCPELSCVRVVSCLIVALWVVRRCVFVRCVVLPGSPNSCPNPPPPAVPLSAVPLICVPPAAVPTSVPPVVPPSVVLLIAMPSITMPFIAVPLTTVPLTTVPTTSSICVPTSVRAWMRA